jgi:hypothetical protein
MKVNIIQVNEKGNLLLPGIKVLFSEASLGFSFQNVLIDNTCSQGESDKSTGDVVFVFLILRGVSFM